MKKVISTLICFILIFSEFFVFVPESKANSLCTTNVEKFANTGFATDLSNWSGTQSYQLDDEYSDTVVAGSVNGTTATDGTNTRTVVDTNSKLSIGGGTANFATGGAANSNPLLAYPTFARSAGTIVCNQMTHTSGNGVDFGWQDISGNYYSYVFSGLPTYVRNGAAGTAIQIGLHSLGTSYKLCSVMRSSGTFSFIKGGSYTSWTMIYPDTSGTTTPLRPFMSYRGTDSVFSSDFVRVPTTTFVPTPLAYDSFSTNGAISTETTGPDSQTTTSLPWTGSTWTVSGGSVSNTPTVGSELLADPGFESWTTPTDLTNWLESIAGTSTVNQETSSVHGGSNAVRLDIDASNSLAQVYQNSVATVGNWYQTSLWAKASGTGRSLGNDDGFFGTNQFLSLTTSYANYTTTNRASLTYLNLKRSTGTSASLYIDDASLKQITPASLFRTVDVGTANVLADVAITGPTSSSGVQGGIVLNLDSTSNPQNFIIVYLDGAGNVKVDEDVAGTYANIASTAVTYSAGAVLRVIKDGTSLDVYYNNAKVGTTSTMTANTSTRVGLFSTYSGNTFDNFTVWARGTGGEYAGIPAEDLTTSRDSTKAYGDSGSAKVIAAGNNNNFYQNVTLAGSKAYNIAGYAYTDGSAVTSSDVQLEANGSTISTTYTSIGGGWYKLTGSVVGTGSSTQYGVSIKAGKTVYLDNMSLNSDDPAVCPAGPPPACSATSPSSAPVINSSTGGDTSITLNFSKAGDPTSYYALEYGTQPNSYPYGSTNIGGSSTTSYTVNSLNPNTTYYFRVRGGNDCATGSWSNEYKATTSGNITAITTIPTAKPVIVPTYEGTSPSPAPIPSPTPVSTQETGFKFSLPKITLSLPKISLPQISLPEISFNVPKITLPTITVPQIVISIPKISLPKVAINFGVFSNGAKAVSSALSSAGSNVSTAVSKSIAFTVFALGEKAQDVSSSIGYSIIEFGYRFVKEPTRISSVKVSVTSPTSATITWTTNHPATSKVNYGETTAYGQDIQSDKRVMEHEIIIDGLNAGTKYFFEVMSQNKTYIYDAFHEFTTPTK